MYNIFMNRYPFHHLPCKLLLMNIPTVHPHCKQLCYEHTSCSPSHFVAYHLGARVPIPHCKLLLRNRTMVHYHLISNHSSRTELLFTIMLCKLLHSYRSSQILCSISPIVNYYWYSGNITNVLHHPFKREVLFCRLRVAGHKYKMSPVAMHILKLIVVYYS
jgi:hypothetical protein